MYVVALSASCLLSKTTATDSVSVSHALPAVILSELVVMKVHRGLQAWSVNLWEIAEGLPERHGLEMKKKLNEAVLRIRCLHEQNMPMLTCDIL